MSGIDSWSSSTSYVNTYYLTAMRCHQSRTHAQCTLYMWVGKGATGICFYFTNKLSLGEWHLVWVRCTGRTDMGKSFAR